MTVHALMTFTDGKYTRGELNTEDASLDEVCGELTRVLASDSGWLTFTRLTDDGIQVPGPVHVMFTPAHIRSIHVWEQETPA